jgi:hypothetical protein
MLGLSSLMLGFRQTTAQPRAPLEGGVQGVEGVGTDFAGLDLAEDRPDVTLVTDPGGRGELGHLEVDVEDPAEEGVAFGRLVPLGLPQQARPSTMAADVSSGHVSRRRRSFPVTGSVRA